MLNRRPEIMNSVKWMVASEEKDIDINWCGRYTTEGLIYIVCIYEKWGWSGVGLNPLPNNCLHPREQP